MNFTRALMIPSNPMINAKTSSDISQTLLDYVDRRGYYRDMGEQGQQWLQKRADEHSTDAFLEMIADCAKVLTG